MERELTATLAAHAELAAECKSLAAELDKERVIAITRERGTAEQLAEARTALGECLSQPCLLPGQRERLERIATGQPTERGEASP
jgi:hypothetical protein